MSRRDFAFQRRDGEADFGPGLPDILLQRARVSLGPLVAALPHRNCSWIQALSSRNDRNVRRGTRFSGSIRFLPTKRRTPPIVSTTTPTINAASHGAIAVASAKTAAASRTSQPLNTIRAPAPSAIAP